MDASKLLIAHENHKIEFEKLFEHFNLLFYGYGCKKNLIKRLFPKCTIINCISENKEEIVQKLLKNPIFKRHNKQISNLDFENQIEKINNILLKKAEMMIIAFLNFNFEELRPFAGKSQLKIIGTLEAIGTVFDPEHLDFYNFIFRDLTTFIPYKEEIVGINLCKESIKLTNVSNVYENVVTRSKMLFYNLVLLFEKQKKVVINEIFELMKKRMMLKNKNECKTLLGEFIAHGIVKIGNNENICLSLSELNRRSFLSKYESQIKKD